MQELRGWDIIYGLPWTRSLISTWELLLCVENELNEQLNVN